MFTAAAPAALLAAGIAGLNLAFGYKASKLRLGEDMMEAFKNLKGDPGVRPVFHQKLERIEAHIVVAFIAYTLHVCLRQRLRRWPAA